MTTVVDTPARVDGVQLHGEMAGSGYREPPALVRRGDGQVLQLTPLLHLVLDAVDGRRDCREIAEVVSHAMRRGVSEEHVCSVLEEHLRPLGLVKGADGSEPELRRANPLLALKYRFAVTNPALTRRLTDPFRLLFRPLVVTLVTLGFLLITGWVFFDRGLGASAYDAFERPHLLLLVFVVTIFSAGLHEFGHAAAARVGGAQPGVMGMGLYLVWPAFYTDVTDSYRLGRGGRIRTDLGGLYFNAIVVVGTFLWWLSTGWEALLLLVATQVLQMTQQLLPLMRFDGYHLLADLAGVPDLYHRIRPTLLGLLPHRWRSPENRALKPTARGLITLWVLITVPMMLLMLWAMIRAVPRMVGSAGSAIGTDARAVAHAWQGGSPIDLAAHTLEVLAVVLPMAGCALILGRLGLRLFSGLKGWSGGSVPKQVVAVVTGGSVVAALAWAWWPDAETYRPIEPDERGTFAALLEQPDSAAARGVTSTAPVDPVAASLARSAPGGRVLATFDEAGRLPTKAAPALAMVLVPKDQDGAGSDAGGQDGAAGEQPWVFPFDKPLPPEDGDNQALAVATRDGSVAYDVAFAMVWVDGDEALNVNEAHAYASCSDCVAVAVAFQVVMVMDGAEVIVPQNLAVATNYDCYRCITAAIANQLVLSVPGEPGEEQLVALAQVWNRLSAYASEITSHSLSDITAQLESVKAEIVEIMGDGATAATSPSPTLATAGQSAGSSPTSASAGAASTPRSTSSTSATASPSASSSPTRTATRTTSPSSSPTASRTAPAESSPSASASP